MPKRIYLFWGRGKKIAILLSECRTSHHWESLFGFILKLNMSFEQLSVCSLISEVRMQAQCILKDLQTQWLPPKPPGCSFSFWKWESVVESGESRGADEGLQGACPVPHWAPGDVLGQRQSWLGPWTLLDADAIVTDVSLLSNQISCLLSVLHRKLFS